MIRSLLTLLFFINLGYSNSHIMAVSLQDKFPFNVNFEKSIKLPDTLKIKNYTNGLAVISVNLNNTGKVTGFNIMKLSIKSSSGKGIEFYQVNREIQKANFYPAPVRRYYPFLLTYVSRMIISRKKETNTPIKPDNYFSVIVRFI